MLRSYLTLVLLSVFTVCASAFALWARAEFVAPFSQPVHKTFSFDEELDAEDIRRLGELGEFDVVLRMRSNMISDPTMAALKKYRISKLTVSMKWPVLPVHISRVKEVAPFALRVSFGPKELTQQALSVLNQRGPMKLIATLDHIPDKEEIGVLSGSRYTAVELDLRGRKLAKDDFKQLVAFLKKFRKRERTLRIGADWPAEWFKMLAGAKGSFQIRVETQDNGVPKHYLDALNERMFKRVTLELDPKLTVKEIAELARIDNFAAMIVVPRGQGIRPAFLKTFKLLNPPGADMPASIKPPPLSDSIKPSEAPGKP